MNERTTYRTTLVSTLKKGMPCDHRAVTARIPHGHRANLRYTYRRKSGTRTGESRVHVPEKVGYTYRRKPGMRTGANRALVFDFSFRCRLQKPTNKPTNNTRAQRQGGAGMSVC